MRNPVVRTNPDSFFEAILRSIQSATMISIKIQVERTVFVIEAKMPLSANGCGETERI